MSEEQSSDGIHWEPAIPVSARECGAWSPAYRLRLWFRRMFARIFA